MKKVVICFLIIIIIGISTYFFLFNKKKEVTFTLNNPSILLNSEHAIKDFIADIENGTIKNGDEIIDTSSIGKKSITIIIENLYNKTIEKELTIDIIDNEAPLIEGVKDITVEYGKEVDLLKDITVTDNSLEEIPPTIEGDYDFNKSGTYNLKYVAKDSSNNITEQEFKLIVKEKKNTTTNKNKSKYYVRVNKTQNVAMVYSKDSNNEYTNLVKTFVISAGDNTPIGTFTATDRYETLSLVGNVWGHYTVRIRNDIWFHSVPYYSKPTKSNPHWDNLEYEEYNKLGTLASKGCIRLAVADAKWIYENILYGTTIEIYESDELPEGVIKPTPIDIDKDSEYKGWDPTDPDPDNPWNK